MSHNQKRGAGSCVSNGGVPQSSNVHDSPEWVGVPQTKAKWRHPLPDGAGELSEKPEDSVVISLTAEDSPGFSGETGARMTRCQSTHRSFPSPQFYCRKHHSQFLHSSSSIISCAFLSFHSHCHCPVQDHQHLP